MALKLPMNIQKEVTCPICLELLTKSLRLGCGHSFCQACITAHSEEAKSSPDGEGSCPVCGLRYPLDTLWTDQHLNNMAERLREVKFGPKEKQKRDLCVHHAEKLLLFCAEDRKVICWLCERSQEHRGHHTFVMEEAVQECQEDGRCSTLWIECGKSVNKWSIGLSLLQQIFTLRKERLRLLLEKLQASLERLRKEQQEAEKLEADIREERISWKYQIQTERQRIQTEFNQLRSILDSEEQRELQRLEEEEKKTLDNLAEAEAELVRQNELVKELISDLEHRSEWSTMKLLQDMSGVMKWGEIWTLKKPKTVSTKLKSVFRAPDLSGMLHMFRELTRVRCYWVDITLNPVNLNLNLVLSEDQRQVMSIPIWPVKCYNYGILGSRYFSSGKHYWEIDVSKKTAWILGVYCRTWSRNVKFDVRQGRKHQNAYSRYRPQFGYWVLGLQNELEYKAFEDSPSADPKILTLSMAIPPCRVGVFLNYEARTVSFFNVTNHGSLIYKFSKCHFSQTAYPYFNPWTCPAPMTLCPPSS